MHIVQRSLVGCIGQLQCFRSYAYDCLCPYLCLCLARIICVGCSLLNITHAVYLSTYSIHKYACMHTYTFCWCLAVLYVCFLVFLFCYYYSPYYFHLISSNFLFISQVEILENGKVITQEKFQFLESDMNQLKTALRINSEQTQLLERKLINANERNEEFSKENKQLREGSWIFNSRIY